MDISDASIEVVEIINGYKGREISAVGRIELSPGIVKNGLIINEERLKEAIKTVLLKSKPASIESGEIILALGDCQTYTHLFKPDYNNGLDSEKKIIEREIERVIPLPLPEIVYSYRIIKNTTEGKEMCKCILVAADKSLLDQWQSFFKKISLEIDSFDFEPLANFRGLKNEDKSRALCLVDIGASSTNIAIFENEELLYSHSISHGGDNFTTAILGQLLLKNKKAILEDAEKIKRNCGFSEKNDCTDYIEAMKKSAEPILEEVKSALNYFYGQAGEAVSDIIIIGGSAKIPKIDKYFNCLLSNYADKNGRKKNLPAVSLGKPILYDEPDSVFYIKAIGASLKNLDNKWSRLEPAAITTVSNRDKKKPEEEYHQEKNEEKKLFHLFYFHKSLAIFILIFTILTSIMIVYNSYSSRQEQIALMKKADKTPATKKIQENLIINVDPKKAAATLIRGRIVKNAPLKSPTEIQSIETSKKEIVKKLISGEKLWGEPIASSSRGNLTAKSQEFSWLAYMDADIKRLLDKKIKEDYKIDGQVIIKKYALSSIAPIASSTAYLSTIKAEILIIK